MKEKKLLIIAYLAVCFFWGSTYLAIKYGVKYFPPLTFAGIRFILAGSMMTLYAHYKQLRFPNSFKALLPIMIVGILMLSGGNGLVTIAEVTVASGVASVFIAMVPLYIAGIELLLFKGVRLSKFGYGGLLLGFIGVYMLINPFSSTSLISLQGTLLLLMAGLFWSFGSVYSKFISKEIHIIPSIGLQMLSGGLVLLLLGRLSHESIGQDFNMVGVYALLYLVVFGSIIGYSSYIYILSKWPAAKAGTYAYVNPVVAVVLGYVLLKEPINATMIFSMTLILMSVFIVQKAKIKGIKANEGVALKKVRKEG